MIVISPGGTGFGVTAYMYLKTVGPSQVNIAGAGTISDHINRGVD